MEVGYVARKESGRGAGELEALCEVTVPEVISPREILAPEQGVAGQACAETTILKTISSLE